MSATTAIQWCDSTFNPWIGCTKVSPGCANCYAERDFDLRKHVAKWGAGQPRHRTSKVYWKQPLMWDKEAARNISYWQEKRSRWIASGQAEHGPGKQWLAMHDAAKPRPPRVFCASLADWLDDEVPMEWLADLLDLILRTPTLDWLLLTKRPQLWRQRLEAAADIGSDVAESWLDGNVPTNVWIGTTVEDQKRADERIPALLQIPARVRFLSCEPLLGPVDLHSQHIKIETWRVGESFDGPAPLDGIHWVICGGESGPKARPMHPDWARSLRDQCAEAGVPFLFKQFGEHNEQGQRVGKHTAGRLLDGREHNEFPKVHP